MMWPIKPLKELVEFKNGLNFSRSDTGNLVKIIGVADFQNRTRITSADELTSVRISGKLRSEHILRPGDLVFVRSNGNKALVGRCLLVDFPEEEVSHSGFTIRARITNPKVLPEFLLGLMQTSLIRSQMHRSGGGTNISNLSQEILGNLLVPLPSMSEQRLLVEVLNAWDDIADQLEHQLSAKRERKRGLMQVLLTGKKRFKEFQESLWITQPLAAHIRTRKKGKPVEVSDAGRGWPYLGSTAFDGVYVDFTEDSNAVMCEPHDVLLLWDGEYAGKSSTGHRGAVGSTVMALKLESTLNNVFLNNLLQFHNPQIRAVREGSGIPHMPSDFFEWFKPAIPPIDEQRKIASVLSVADAEIANLEKQLNAYKLQKRGLMQQLLTGRKRVKLDDLEAVA